MNKILFILWFFQVLQLQSQNCSLLKFDLGTSTNNKKADSTICKGDSIQLFANVPSLKQTTSYLVSSIPYVSSLPCESVGTVPAGYSLPDDRASFALNIGFNFCYFGTNFTQFVMNPNGGIVLGTAASNFYPMEWDAQTLPYTQYTSPNGLFYNSIYGALMDINVDAVGATGSITYQNVGVAPYRALIVKFINCSYYGSNCKNLKLNLRIVLYETTNIIEIYTGTKPLSFSCPSGSVFPEQSTQGLMGPNSSSAVAVPGRNNTAWSGDSTAFRFTPNGISNTVNINWLNNGVSVGTGTSQKIKINTDSATIVGVCSITSTCPASTIVVNDTFKVRTNAKLNSTTTYVDSLPCKDSIQLDAKTPAFKYLWSTGATSRFVKVINPSTYTAVRIIDSLGCGRDTSVFNINAKLAKLKIDSLVPFGCFNSSKNGTVWLHAQNSKGWIKYGLSLSNLQTSPSVPNVGYGNNKFYIKDSINCVDSSVLFLDSLNTSSSMIPLKCFNDSSGKIKISASGGKSPYSYSLNGILYSSADSFVGLKATTFDYFVKDSFQCVLSKKTTLTQPTRLTSSILTDSSFCFGDSTGKITITGSGGTSPYQYSRNNATFQSSSLFSGLKPQLYTLNVRDNNNCVSDTFATIYTNDSIRASIAMDSITCHNANDGKATLTTQGGVAPYQYQIDGGTFQSSNLLTNISSGTHIITIKDAKNCTRSYTVSYANPLQINISVVSKKNVSCFNGTDGNIKVLASGSYTPFSYQWSTGSNADSIANLSANTYKIIATDTRLCKDSINVTITQPTDIAIGFTNVNLKCNRDSNGVIKITASGGTAPYRYSQDNVSYTLVDSIKNLKANTYTVFVKDTNNCVKNGTTTLTQPTRLTSSILTDSSFCFGDSTGKITITGSGGTSPYQYSRNNATFQSSSLFSGLKPQLYTLNLRDNNNCVSDTFATIYTNDSIRASIAMDSITCHNANDGKATLTTQGGVAPYQYQIDGGTFQSSNLLTNISSGTHTITIKDAKNCTRSYTVSYANPLQINISVVSKKNVSCFNGTDGNIKVLASGSYTPFSYQWSTGSNADSIANLSANTYKIIATDTRLCKDSVNVTITQPTDIAIGFTNVNLKCNRDSNGVIKITASGGTAPYRYSQDNVSYTLVDSIKNLKANSYTVYVKDTNNCVKNGTTTLTQPTRLTSSILTDSSFCFGDSTGKITITGSGGTSPYQYSRNNATFQSSSLFSGLKPQLYTLNVRDNNNCVSDTFATIYTNDSIRASIAMDSITCHNANDGKATLTTQGGVAPYQYQIDGGTFQSSNLLTNISSGTHTITIKDAKNCTRSYTVSYANPLQINISVVSKKNVSCFNGTDGNIKVLASGSYTPFSYQWSTGSNADSIANLSANTYKIIATDTRLCKDSVNVTITQPTDIAIGFTNVNLKCNRDSNGVIKITASGGTAPYRYSQDNVSYTLVDSIKNLKANSYTVYVKDTNNCVKNGTTTLTQPTRLTSSILTDSSFCFGDSTGKITITGSGGTSPYQYSRNNATFQSSSLFSGLKPQLYTLNVRDNNNCVSDTFATIYTNDSIRALIAMDSITCHNANDGKATLTTQGGVAPYQYQIDGGTFQSSNLLTNISSGTHTITIKDAKNCTRSYTVSYANPNQVLITLNFKKNITCNGGQDGAIKITGSNAFAPYTYTWSNGMTSDSIFSLISSAYTVTVSDRNNCTNTLIVNLTEPSKLVITPRLYDLKCNQDGAGAIAISVVGGVPGYSYNWSNGSKVDSIATLASGSYTITVTDAKNCPMVGTYTLIEPKPLTFNLTSTKSACLESQNGVANIVSVNGGTPPYSYSWSNGSIGALSVSNLKPLQNYSATVVDKNNCSKIDSIFIDTIYRLNVKIAGVLSKCPDIPASMTLISLNGSSPYQYTINGRVTADGVYSSVPNTILAISVIDANNCPFIDTQDLTIKDSMRPSLVNHVPNCTDASMFGSKMNVTGGYPPYSYRWPGAVKVFGDSAVHIKGSYQVEVKDQYCSKTLTFFLDPPDGLLQSMVSKKQGVSCFGGHDGQMRLKTYGGKKPYFYKWSDGQKDSIGVGLYASKTYQISITDINGCLFTINDSVSQPDQIKTMIVQKNPTCADKKDGMISLKSNGGTPSVKGYLYALDSQSFGTSNVFWGISGKKYSVWTKDSNQCLIRDTVVMITPPKLLISLPSTHDATYGVDLALNPVLTDPNNMYRDSIQYQWSPSIGLNCMDCKSTLFSGYVPQHYTFYVTYGKGCMDSAKTYVKLLPIQEEIYIPSAFNPASNNEENRTIKVYGTKIVKLRMSIYNRWGEKVFYTESIESFWDGTYKGVQATNGVYTYEMEVQLINQKIITKHGSFMKF